jgi:O-antigen/teichoic acid export membrane protein
MQLVGLEGKDERDRLDRFLATPSGIVRKAGGAALAVGLGRAGVALAQIILVRISTQLLTPAQMGGVSQMGSLASFFSILLVVPVGHYITRGFLEWHDAGRLQGYLKRYFAYILFVAFGAVVAAWGVQAQWQLVSGFSTAAIALLIGLYMLSSPVSALGTTGLNLLNQRVKFAVFSNLPVWVSLGLSPILFIQYGNPAFWSLGQYIGLAIGCLSCWVLWRHLSDGAVVPLPAQGRPLPFSVSAIFGFAWPVMMTASLWWLQSQSYKFVLDRIQGAANVGLFAVGYSLAAAPIAMYEGLFGQFYEPIFYGELKGQGVEGQARAWNNYARAYLPGLVVVGTYVAAGSPFLAQVLLGKTFRTAAIQLALWAAIIETMRAAGAMMYHLGVAKINTRITILPVSAGALLAPLSVLLLGQFDPLLGTVAGLFIAGFAVMVIIIATSRRALPIDWPVRRTMVGLVLSVPLAVGFRMTYWISPQPRAVLSLFVLALGGVYLVAAQAWLFTRRGNV